MKNFSDFTAHIDWERAIEQSKAAVAHAKAFKLSQLNQQNSEHAMFFMSILEQYHDWLHVSGD